MANLKLAFAEQIQLLKTNDAFKAFLAVLADVRIAAVEKLQSTPIDSPSFERLMAQRQGILVGLDKVYDIMSDADIAVKNANMRGDNGRE